MPSGVGVIVVGVTFVVDGVLGVDAVVMLDFTVGVDFAVEGTFLTASTVAEGPTDVSPPLSSAGAGDDDALEDVVGSTSGVDGAAPEVEGSGGTLTIVEAPDELPS